MFSICKKITLTLGFTTIAVIAALATLGTVNAAQAIEIIDTTPGSSFQGPFGESQSPFFGQTITVPTNNTVLTSFTFFIDGFDDPDSVEFVANVSEWDNVNFRPRGLILFQSKPYSTTQGEGLEAFTFNTGRLALNPNEQYVLYLSALFDGIKGRGKLPQRLDDPLLEGDLVISNNGSSWFLGTRTTGGVDLAFRATFDTVTTVPESSFALSLLFISSLGIGTKLLLKQK